MTADFPKFDPGDPISAAKMNSLVDYAGRVYRAMPSFVVPEEPARLVVAVEDFCERISDHLTIDDVPSGRCRLVRINNTNQHYAESGGDFWVHDPCAGMFDAPSVIDGDIFHVIFNTVSRRWEIPYTGPRIIHIWYAEEIPVAEDSLENPSYGLANVCRKLPDGKLKKTTKTVLLTNRFRRLSFPPNTYGTATFVEQEWQPTTADCPPGSESVADYDSESYC